MSRIENILAGGLIGGAYGLGSVALQSYRAGQGIPPLRYLGREALSEATEWAGAVFMTEMMVGGEFPQDLQGLGQFLTVALWLEAIFPRIIGER
jgi:FtsH-binding integral membrane protein